MLWFGGGLAHGMLSVMFVVSERVVGRLSLWTYTPHILYGYRSDILILCKHELFPTRAMPVLVTYPFVQSHTQVNITPRKSSV